MFNVGCLALRLDHLLNSFCRKVLIVFIAEELLFLHHGINNNQPCHFNRKCYKRNQETDESTRL